MKLKSFAGIRQLTNELILDKKMFQSKNNAKLQVLKG